MCSLKLALGAVKTKKKKKPPTNSIAVPHCGPRAAYGRVTLRSHAIIVLPTSRGEICDFLTPLSSDLFLRVRIIVLSVKASFTVTSFRNT